MGKIHKHFWKWDDRIYNLSPYKLRESISKLKKNKLINESENDSFSGINGFPWSINENKGKVYSVFFNRGAFFPIHGDESVWDLEYNDFLEFMNKNLESVDENYKGDKLYVVFRDFYATMSGIIAGKMEI